MLAVSFSVESAEADAPPVPTLTGAQAPTKLLDRGRASATRSNPERNRARRARIFSPGHPLAKSGKRATGRDSPRLFVVSAVSQGGRPALGRTAVRDRKPSWRGHSYRGARLTLARNRRGETRAIRGVFSLGRDDALSGEVRKSRSRRFLENHAGVFGIAGDESDVELVRDVRGTNEQHLKYQTTLQGCAGLG